MGCGFVALSVWVAWVELLTQFFYLLQRNVVWFCGFDCLGCLCWAANSKNLYRPEKCAVVLWLWLFGLSELSIQLIFFISSREMWCGFVASTVWVAWVEQPTQIFVIIQRNRLWFCGSTAWVGWAGNSKFSYRPAKCGVVLWFRLLGLFELSCQLKFLISSREIGCGFVVQLPGLVEQATQIFHIVQRNVLWFCSFDCLGCLSWAANSNFWYRPEK